MTSILIPILMFCGAHNKSCISKYFHCAKNQPYLQGEDALNQCFENKGTPQVQSIQKETNDSICRNQAAQMAIATKNSDLSAWTREYNNCMKGFL